MRYYYLLLFILPSFAFAQPYGNEWINFGQDYYKISLADDGVYRLTYDDMNAAGFDLSVDPRSIQIFRKGIEIAIYVEGESDATLDPTDFIEFYGQKNDGTLDKELYITPSAQPHSYYNLYSDSSAYFLTSQPGIVGKRMVNPSPFTGVAKDDYYNREVLKVFSDQYSHGITVSSYTSLTQFDIGEGFTGPKFTEVTNPTFNINLANLDLPVVSAPDPQLELLLVGRNNTNHTIEVFVGPDVSGLRSLGQYNFLSFNSFKINSTLNWTDISAGGNLLVRIKIINDGGTQSNISVSYIKVDYPRQTNMLGNNLQDFDLQVKGNGGDVIEILNTPADAKVYDVTDPNNVARITDTDVNTNTITCGFSDATVARKLVVASPLASALTLKKVGFRKIDPNASNYLVISNKVLMAPVGSTNDAVRAYAGYRASSAGGSYDTLVVDINQLYDQFSYGEVTPLSIYHFMAFMVNNGNPEDLLLIGKALDVSYKYHRSDPATFAYHDLVPTAGSPGADLPFTANLNGAGIEGAVPVGRLSFSTPQEIINYLNKVVEMESTPYDALWRKNLLHLSGGNSLSELDLFKSYVDGFKAVAEDDYLGGKVSTVSKATTATVEFINVSEKVNDGLNLITFFGHSAPSVTDIDIGFVSDPVNGYNNKGKYPVVLMNGCNAGNIYNPNYIFGEDWVATANKGATAVIAHTSYGFPFSLKLWSDTFYALAYSDTSFIEKSIGQIQLEIGRKILDFTGPTPNYIYQTQIQQMGLQGDPAIKIFGSRKPDFETNLNSIEARSLTDQGITSEADSFALAIVVRNFGATVTDSLEISVKRTLQNGTLIDYGIVSYAPVKYLDTLYYTIDNTLLNNAGTNSFEIMLDPAGKIDEHDEMNNLVFFNQFIPLSGTINITPYNYAIQPIPMMDMLTQSGNLLAKDRGYLFELDSTLLFTSPFKQAASANANLLAKWPGVNLLNSDTTAYYWRSKYAQLNPGEADVWTNSTFTYIAGADEGWAQVAFQQMKDNNLSGLKMNEGARTINFLQTSLPIEVTVHGANSVDFTYQDTELIIDELPFVFPGTFTLCADNRLQIVAFNQENAAPYAPILGNQVEQWSCGRSPQVINSYPGGKSLDEILDAIPVGDKVLLFTTGSFDFNTLSAVTLAKLEDLGADATVIGTKQPDEPYIMLGFKGAGGGNSLAEIIADPASVIPTDGQTLHFTTNINGVFATGDMMSPVIGPALSWDRLNYRVNIKDVSDTYWMDIIGKDFNGAETTLFSKVQTNEVILNTIDPLQYPYLKLKLHIEDPVTKTAPQLDHWIVNYLAPPEGLIIYLNNSEGGDLSITKQEGEEVTTNFGFVNISNKDFTDSLTVTYTIFNQDQAKSVRETKRIPGPLAGDTIPINILMNTVGMVGVNNLNVSVNSLEVAEQVYENNNIGLSNYVTVTRDATNPLLEVSFDGEYIFDGDIVSPNPNIHIVMRDENPYILKTDTTGIDIFLSKPCMGCGAERVSLSRDDITWSPQTESEPFKIDFAPKDLADGVYELSVQVEDASGNKSGIEPYSIHFEVINKSTITNFYPYPNPFSTSVKFIFTLTGSEVPDQILIRIFTVSGRVVREITQDELGPLRIGNNVTDYAWDGHDEYGDQLANGVYLYKVYVRKNGKQIQLRQSGGDRGFKDGYGKLYLLR